MLFNFHYISCLVFKAVNKTHNTFLWSPHSLQHNHKRPSPNPTLSCLQTLRSVFRHLGVSHYILEGLGSIPSSCRILLHHVHSQPTRSKWQVDYALHSQQVLGQTIEKSSFDSRQGAWRASHTDSRAHPASYSTGAVRSSSAAVKKRWRCPSTIPFAIITWFQITLKTILSFTPAILISLNVTVLRKCFETSAYKIQTPGNFPEESIKQLNLTFWHRSFTFKF